MPHVPVQLRASRAGFTLVELILVLGIIATLSAMAIPRFGRTVARHRADAAARRVAADLEEAQFRARAASAACSMRFTPASGTILITYPTIAGVPGRSVKTSLGLSPYLAQISSASFGGKTDLSFDGFGKPDSGGTVIIECADERRTITLTEKTGMITIE